MLNKKVEVNGIPNRRDDLPDASGRLPIVWNIKNGGGERDRTDDLLLAKQALSQLSYTPEKNLFHKFLS